MSVLSPGPQPVLTATATATVDTVDIARSLSSPLLRVCARSTRRRQTYHGGMMVPQWQRVLQACVRRTANPGPDGASSQHGRSACPLVLRVFVFVFHRTDLPLFSNYTFKKFPKKKRKKIFVPHGAVKVVHIPFCARGVFHCCRFCDALQAPRRPHCPKLGTMLFPAPVIKP